MHLLKSTVAAYYEARGGKAKTIALSLATVVRFEEYLGRPATLDDLTDAKLRGFTTARRNQGRSLNTVNGEAEKLLSLWRWVARDGTIPPPDFTAPPKEKKLPRALTRDDLQRFSDTAMRTRQTLCGVPGAVYWPALIWVCYHTAERIGAVRQLRWDCVDLDTGWITFSAETRKGQKAEIARRVSYETVLLLRRLRDLENRTPFGVVYGSAWYNYWNALRAESGLPEWLTPHRLRSSAASHLERPEDAMRLLGHQSMATTIENYRDPRVVKEPSLLTDLEKPRPQTLAEWLATPGRAVFRRLGWTG